MFSSEEAGRLILEQEVGEGTTVGDLIRKLATQNPAFGEVAYDSIAGKLSNDVSIVLNDRFLGPLTGLQTNIRDGDKITLFPTITGG